MKTTDLSNYLVKIYIRLDDRVDMFEVQGMHLTSLLEDMGGFYSFIYDISIFIVCYTAQDEFWASLIEALFRTKKNSVDNPDDQEPK